MPRGSNMNNLRHGLSYTRIYKIWSGMIKRCTNPKCPSYKSYGAKGISVCEAWRKSFEAFYSDMKDSYSDELTLDRIDTDGNYEPSNCRWATVKDQQRNRKMSRMVTYNGETRCLSEWAEVLNIKRHLIKERLNSNWPLEQVFDPTPTTRWQRRKRNAAIY